MASTTTGLFETLVAGMSEASQHLKYSNAFSELVYAGYEPITAQYGQTLNVLIPTVSEANTADIGGGPIQVRDTDHTSRSIVFDKHFSDSFIIKTWDQIRTPRQLADLYLQPAMEGLLRKVNNTLVQLVNTTQFSTHASITGGADTFTRANMGTAWSNLAAAGVPVDTPGDLNLVTHPVPYANMLSTTDFYQESVVGINTAEMTQQRAMLAPAFNTRLAWDQHFVAVSGAYPALMFHKHAIAVVSANLPGSNDHSVMETTSFVRPWLPVQVQMQYSLKDQGHIIHMHCGWGVKVTRPEYGCYMVST